MSKESNCVRCNKHPKKAGESVCKVCYDSGSGYFDMVGNDLADYFEWPEDEKFGAEGDKALYFYEKEAEKMYGYGYEMAIPKYIVISDQSTFDEPQWMAQITDSPTAELAGLGEGSILDMEEGWYAKSEYSSKELIEYLENKYPTLEIIGPASRLGVRAEEFGADSRVMNEELMESIMNVFLKNNIRDKREQLKELMFIYGALEEEMYMGAEEFGADFVECNNESCDKGHCPTCGNCWDGIELSCSKCGDDWGGYSKLLDRELYGAESDYTLKDWWQQSMDNCICGGNGCLYCEEINKDYDENIALSDLRKISKIVGTDCHCDKTYEDDVLQCYNCQTAMTLEKFGAEGNESFSSDSKHCSHSWEDIGYQMGKKVWHCGFCNEIRESSRIPHSRSVCCPMNCTCNKSAESFAATKGMDTYAQPFSELKIKPTKTKVGILIATIVAGGFWYSKKMKE